MPLKQATLDILDSELRSSHDNYMNMALDDHIKIYERQITVAPRLWKDNLARVSKVKYRWQEVKYTDLPKEIENSQKPLDNIGIYYFSVRPDFLINQQPSYVFYVGIAGEGNSQRTLRQRLQDYLYVNKLEKRKNVHKTLQLYYEFIIVNYSIMPALTSQQLEELEVHLHDYLYPWVNSRDFSPSVKDAQKAWGH